MSVVVTEQAEARERTPANGPEPLWTVDDFATYCGVSTGTVYPLIEKGKLRAIRVGRLIRIPESAVTEFISNGGK